MLSVFVLEALTSVRDAVLSLTLLLVIRPNKSVFVGIISSFLVMISLLSAEWDSSCCLITLSSKSSVVTIKFFLTSLAFEASNIAFTFSLKFVLAFPTPALSLHDETGFWRVSEDPEAVSISPSTLDSFFKLFRWNELSVEIQQILDTSLDFSLLCKTELVARLTDWLSAVMFFTLDITWVPDLKTFVAWCNNVLGTAVFSFCKFSSSQVIRVKSSIVSSEGLTSCMADTSSKLSSRLTTGPFDISSSESMSSNFGFLTTSALITWLVSADDRFRSKSP